MPRSLKLIFGGAAVAAVAALGTGVANAGAGSDEATEHPIVGEARTRAESAALAFVPGGRVTDTEEGDEESLYEVEVKKADGSEVDVQLDADFKVVGRKSDGGTAGG